MQWPCSTCGGMQASVHAMSAGVNSTFWTPRCSESRICGRRGHGVGAQEYGANGHVGKVSGAWPRGVAAEGTYRRRGVPRERSSLQGVWPALGQSLRMWTQRRSQGRQGARKRLHPASSSQSHTVSLHSYLSHLERISEDSYIPTAQDVLRSRMPTTGINEYCFSVKKTKLR